MQRSRIFDGLLFLACSVCFCMPLFAGEDTDQLMKAGSEAFKNGDYSKAIGIFSTVTEKKQDLLPAWSQLGLAYHFDKQYDKAIPIYKKLVDANWGVHLFSYNLACAYSLKGEKVVALQWLSRAMQSGFRDYELLMSDSDLQNIRAEKHFAEIADQVQRLARPCATPEYHQLDFWIGEWTVSANGQPIGKNVVEPMLRDCAIMENFNGYGAISGTSISRYDAQTETWSHWWIDDKGGALYLKGRLEDGVMTFQGTKPGAEGETVYHRLKLYPNDDGTVSQVVEKSMDEGQNWLTVFEGLYTRIAAPREEAEARTAGNSD